MTFTWILSFVFIYSTTAESESPPPDTICIIGGGLSGLTLANLLQSRGHDVTLYEAESRFGGKILTYRSKSATGDPIQLEQGPIWFSNKMSYILKHLSAYNVSYTPYKVHDFSLFDPSNGVIYPRQEFPPKMVASLSAAVARYKVAWREATNSSAALELGYASLNPAQLEDLSKPIATWLEDHALSELTPLFIPFLTGDGYGGIRETPALYALKVITDEDSDTLVFSGGTFTVSQGYDVWVKRIAAQVRNKYHGWKAVSLKRIQENGETRQEIRFQVKGTKEPVAVSCAKTILAFPPLLNNLAELISDLSEKETEILNQVKVVKYVSTGVRVPHLKRVTYIGMVPRIGIDYDRNVFPEVSDPAGDGGVIVLCKQRQSYYNAYSWIAGDFSDRANEVDLEGMRAKLNATIRKMYPFSKMLGSRSTPYFPHVSSESLRNGFYKDFNSLQGVRGVYYATTLLTLESMNNALEMAEKFVEKYF